MAITALGDFTSKGPKGSGRCDPPCALDRAIRARRLQKGLAYLKSMRRTPFAPESPAMFGHAVIDTAFMHRAAKRGLTRIGLADGANGLAHDQNEVLRGGSLGDCNSRPAARHLAKCGVHHQRPRNNQSRYGSGLVELSQGFLILVFD